MNLTGISFLVFLFLSWVTAVAQTWTWNTVSSSQMIENAQGVTSICSAGEGRVWIGTDAGLVLYSNQQFSPISNLSGQFIRCLLWDSLNATLWVGTDGGGLFSNNGNAWAQVFPQSQIGNPESRIQSLALHQGSLWVGGAEKGLFKWDGASWQQFNSLTTAGQLPFSAVNALLSANSGLWVATQTHGLYQLLDQGGFTYLSVDSGLPSNQVQSLYSKGPYMWIGHSGTQSNTHLSRYHTQQKTTEVFGPETGFPALRQVYAFAEDSAGRMWIGSHMSDFPLAYFDGQNFTGIPEFTSGFLSTPIASLMRDSGQSMWVGHFGGVSVNTLLPTSIIPAQDASMLLPYPNPFGEVLHIPGQTTDGLWELIGVHGETIAVGRGNVLSGAGIKPGLYLLRYAAEADATKTALILRKND